MNRLKSVKSHRHDQKELSAFMQTFNRFQTAFARCCEPEVKSKHKLLLFQRTPTKKDTDKSINFSLYDSVQSSRVKNSLRAPSLATQKHSYNSSRRMSLDHNSFRQTQQYFTPPSTYSKERRYRPSTAHAGSHRLQTSSPVKTTFPQPIVKQDQQTIKMLHQLYQAKCQDLKVQATVKQRDIFTKRLIANITSRKFVCPQNGFSLNSLQVICPYIKAHSSIITLILDKNSLGDSAASIIAQMIPQSHLIKLSLVSTNISAAGAWAIFYSISDSIYLTDLNMSSAEGLFRNKIGHDGIQSLKEALKHVFTLHCLDLSGSSISQEGWKTLASGLQKNQSLCSLNVGRNEISEATFTSSIHQLTYCNLVLLNLGRNAIRDQGLISLTDILCQTTRKKCLASCLKYLNIAQNGLTSISFDYFFKMMVRNFCLQTLIIDGNSPAKGHRFQTIRMYLHSVKNLQTFSIRQCNLETDDILYVCEGMEYNNSILSIDLSHNNIEKVALTYICQFLRLNKTLRNLKLRKCGLSDEQIKPLCDAICQNKKMQGLWLEHNFIKDEGATKLEQLLMKNPQLVEMHLQKNMIGLQKLSSLGRALKNNREVDTLCQPNLEPYEIRGQENVKRKLDLQDNILMLKRKYEQLHRRNVQEHILYLDCAIEDAQKRLEIEQQKLKEAGSKVPTVFCTDPLQ